MKMGGYGLGGAMLTASRFADSRGVFAGIVEIAIVGYVLIKAMALLRRRLAGQELAFRPIYLERKGKLMPVGFYKRGCQEKTLLPYSQEGFFSDIQPLLCGVDLGAGA